MSYNSPFTGNVIQPTDVSYRDITISNTNLQLEWPINGNATDDFAAVRAHADEILRNDRRVLRIVPGWEDDARMKPYWGPPPE